MNGSTNNVYKVTTLDSYEEGTSVTSIRVQLEVLGNEFVSFAKLQTKVNQTDDSHSMRERISLKNVFENFKARATDIIDKSTQSQIPMRNTRNLQGKSYFHAESAFSRTANDPVSQTNSA